MKEKTFTIGTDPEFFMVEEGTGKLKSSIPHINGTKYEPEIMECGAGLQRDNVAVEFASVPAKDEASFVSSISKAFMDLAKRLPNGHGIVAEPSACFDEDQLDCPEAFEFGCDEDYDAWEVAPNPTPYCEDKTFRSCGAHIHLGHVKGSGNDFLLDPYGKLSVVRAMDAVHGVISVVLDNSEKSVKRRLLYGKAGCHRPTDYGVEYRVLSNFWLKSPELVMLMYRLSADVLRLVREGEHETLIERSGGKDKIVEVINGGKVEEAVELMNNRIKDVLSQATLEILDMCLEKCKTYDFKREWRATNA